VHQRFNNEKCCVQTELACDVGLYVTEVVSFVRLKRLLLEKEMKISVLDEEWPPCCWELPSAWVMFGLYGLVAVAILGLILTNV
jgi:hypothetical protein